MMEQTTLEMKRAELDAILRDEEADLQGRVIRGPDVLRARVRRRQQLERELAAAAGDEYSEELPLDHVIGDEWHIVSNHARDTVVICGDVQGATSTLFHFDYTEEFRISSPSDDSGVFSSGGNGLGIYGLFLVRNSKLQRDVLAIRE